ncbi:hypothetical protein AALP_AA3G254300 [Arabis alpina]|uniref:Acid phosphatase 1-like n=1 Tax=Arabis alpina TaxID=50452 RepID=A0A087HBL5_ARAAL|nr:hypothetical protein AALP_AA3G254300 [Arabis alpina]
MAFSRSGSVSFLILAAFFAVLTNQALSSRVTPFIELPSSIADLESQSDLSVGSYCESWRLAVETNNAGSWKVVPTKCVSSVAIYYDKGQFARDYNVVANYALAFARTIKLGGDGKDAWVFDIDETLLSNLAYYSAHGYGSEPYNSIAFNEWVVEGTALGFRASVRLFNALKKLGFKIILLTGRDEGQRSITESNLRDAGYSGWERLLLRGHKDQGKAAVQYKSEQRESMVKLGFKLHGNTGDQWSDLEGFAVATRSFKVPNPLYYIP